MTAKVSAGGIRVQRVRRPACHAAQRHQLVGSPVRQAQRLAEPRAAQRWRPVLEQHPDELRASRPPAVATGPRSLGGRARRRVERRTTARPAGPLRIGVERVADRAAQPHPHPRNRVRIVAARPEHEPPGQAHHPDQAERRADPELAPPTTGRRRSRRSTAASTARPAGRPRLRPAAPADECRRSDSTSPSSAAPWWPTSCTSDEAMPCPTIRSRGTRMSATGLARRPAAGSGPGGSPRPARAPGSRSPAAARRSTRQRQRVRGQHVQPGRARPRSRARCAG